MAGQWQSCSAPGPCGSFAGRHIWPTKKTDGDLRTEGRGGGWGGRVLSSVLGQEAVTAKVQVLPCTSSGSLPYLICTMGTGIGPTSSNSRDNEMPGIKRT